MEKNNVLIDKWEIKNSDIIYENKNDCVRPIFQFFDREKAELSITAVNACKAINPGNPLKVAIYMERLFKVLEKVINDKKMPLNLSLELTSIIDTLKSEF